MQHAYAIPALTVGSLVFDRTHLCSNNCVLSLTANSVELRLPRHYPGGAATRQWFTRTAFDARFSLQPLSSAAPDEEQPA